MHYGFIVTNFHYCGEARVLADLAREAEDAGWDGFFIWDHIQFPGAEPTADPWVALAAMAVGTERIRLGTMVTPVPRRRPGKLARETLTLDHLSNGRLIFGAGAGYPGIPEYAGFGDEADPKTRGAMLDEGLDVLAALWSGEPVEHNGEHYRVQCDAMQPPVQQPRIPVWVAGTWPFKKPFRRAARWDGVVPMHQEAMAGVSIEPDELTDLVGYVNAHRSGDGPYDVCQYGTTRDAGDTAAVGAYAEAGATWWVETVFSGIVTLDDTRARLRHGPPRV